MASDIQRRRNEYTEDLNDLQSQYTKQRRKLVRSQEEDLANLREVAKERREQVEEQTEAAISHIKKAGHKSVEAVASESEERVQNIKERNQNEINTYKKHVDNTSKALEQQLRSKDQIVNENIQQLTKRENEIRKKQQASTQNYLNKQQEALQKANQKAKDEVSTAYVKGNEERKKIQERQEQDIKKLQTNYSQTFKKEDESRGEILAKYRADGRKSMDQVTTKNRQMTEAERLRGEKEVNQTRQVYQGEKARMVAENESQLSETRTQHLTRIENDQQRAEIKREKIRTQKEKELAETNKMGEHKVSEEKKRIADNLARQQAFEEEELAREKMKYDARRENQTQNYAKSLEETKSLHQRNIDQKRKDNRENYQNLEKAHRESVAVQQNTYNKAIVDIKRQQIGQVKNYASRFHDPFYKVKDPGSEFWETSTEYRLRAHIPEHEKQNISVRIQPDRVTVTGKRTYTDDLKEENRKLSSSNLQTFREEYAFDTNVQHNFTTQERNGDWVEFIIPKAGIYSKKA